MSKAKPKPGDPMERVSIVHRDGPLEAALRVRDRTVHDYDRRWGPDVLQTLVSPETAAKFAKVRDRLDNAIRGGDVDTAINTMAVEMRGLKAMEDEALAAGRKPLDPGHRWATRDEDGQPWVFVQTEDDARAAARSGRFTGYQIWSLPEVIRVLKDKSFESVLKAKGMWPEAAVTAVKPPVDWRKGDEVPF